MDMRLVRIVGALLVTLSFTPVATASEPAVEAAAAGSADSMDQGSPRSKSESWMIPPGNTGTIGGQFAFMTASGPLTDLLGGRRLEFTDVVFLRLDARYSIAGVAELIVDTTLLPKQPSYTDESVFQNAGLGFRIGLAKWLAAALRFDGGTTVDADGAWAAATAGVEARLPIDDYVKFDLGLYGQGTALFIDDEAPRFAEVVGNAQVVFANPGDGGLWVGTSFHFPVADEPSTSYPIDPHTRANFNIGGVLSFIDDWDLYAKYSFIDRGDLPEAPDTILPILDGGFDQQQLALGVVHRFDFSKQNQPYR
jgi:hypothetical protein